MTNITVAGRDGERVRQKESRVRNQTRGKEKRKAEKENITVAWGLRIKQGQLTQKREEIRLSEKTAYGNSFSLF